MIKVKVKKNIIKISGHAKYNDYGSDIVCASVSSIVYTTINGILNIESNTIQVFDDNDLTIKILKDDEVTNILIDNMIALLEELEQQYPENIKIK